MDATRISDNEMVVLKRIYFPPEVEIAMLFSTEPLASHPKNHCVPIYESFRIPDEENDLIIVMPQLRPFDNPRFKSVGEAVEFFGQIFEVILVLLLLPRFYNVVLRDYNSCTSVVLSIGIYPCLPARSFIYSLIQQRLQWLQHHDGSPSNIS